MFEKNDNRYLTKGVNEQLPKEIQVYCWQLIDQKRKEAETKLDYLQIFEFNRDEQRQAVEVIYRQEEPFFITYHEYKITNSLSNFQVKKLWVIDDGTNQTMLLPEEY
ncbi:DUF960 family protein [Enterococcus rivorum]|uniref:DUF960 domain-containing protein n=1 Tax=Enterococcus rivorum TaxID=762845 RepID=A0A1E5KUC2_9ENTE|nr:DUF960 family protein [Enterococcus rivorum]MBP2100661.1 hypothetical protein [Enterococcus rivorum]OEH81494.1 hypothetical protein BCR26_04430 [Enterococcus rivorum]